MLREMAAERPNSVPRRTRVVLMVLCLRVSETRKSSFLKLLFKSHGARKSNTRLAHQAKKVGKAQRHIAAADSELRRSEGGRLGSLPRKRRRRWRIAAIAAMPSGMQRILQLPSRPMAIPIGHPEGDISKGGVLRRLNPPKDTPSN